jgi:translocator protein
MRKLHVTHGERNQMRKRGVKTRGHVTTPKQQLLGLLVLLVVCFAAAGIGGAATSPNIATWYATLSKPSWNPPNWIFGPVWTALYISMAVAAWLVWRQGGLEQAKVPLLLFAVQLVLNAAWSWFFFGFHAPGAAFIDIVALLAAIVATTTAFWGRSLAAGILMTPYLAWVAFATVLNFAIWRLN